MEVLRSKFVKRTVAAIAASIALGACSTELPDPRRANRSPKVTKAPTPTPTFTPNPTEFIGPLRPSAEPTPTVAKPKIPANEKYCTSLEFEVGPYQEHTYINRHQSKDSGPQDDYKLSLGRDEATRSLSVRVNYLDEEEDRITTRFLYEYPESSAQVRIEEHGASATFKVLGQTAGGMMVKSTFCGPTEYND